MSLENDTFAPENIRPRAYLEYKSIVPIGELVDLMKSFCDHVNELTSTERSAALFIIKKGIDNL